MGSLIFDALVAFFGMTILDIAFAFYVRAAAQGREVAAGSWATLILVMNGVVIMGFVSNPWLLMPAGAGAYIGTVIAIKISKRLEND